MDIHLITHSVIVAKIKEALQASCPDLRGKTIVAAISGGHDSTVMLVVLSVIARENAFSLVACHVNHMLRGKESDEDADFCRRLCERMAVPLTVYEAGPQEAISEADLRATRYGLLETCARAHDTELIATAHTQDDQVETILFRLFRGSSITGLAGMKTIKYMKNGMVLLRPLLEITRAEVLHFLSSNEIAAREDSSNREIHFNRNFLRHQVIPGVMQRFTSLPVQVERLRKIICAEDDFMRLQANQLFDQLNEKNADRWSIEELTAAHLSLRRRCVARALDDRQIEPSFERIETILNMVTNESSAPRLSLDGNWDVKRSGPHLVWLHKSAQPQQDIDVTLTVPGETEVQRYRIKIEPWHGAAPKDFPPRQSFEVYVDLSSANLPLRYRLVQNDDKIQPLGMSQAVSLRQFLRTHKPLAGSAGGVCVISDSLEVLWVPGYGMSEKLRVQSAPSHRIVVEVF